MRLSALAAPALALAFALAGGCAQAEKAQYMRHLTTVVESSAEIPEEVVLTFDLDRKQLPPRAVAAGTEN